MILLVILAGCAHLMFQEAPVHFLDASEKLRVIAEEPTDSEKDGITLRFKPPLPGEEKFREENEIYTSIHKGKGRLLQFQMEHKQIYRPSALGDSFTQRTETVFLGERGEITTELELNDRGEILKFLEGYHQSPIGKFRIIHWTRSPLFPDKKVTRGESWNYEETMEVRLDSFWVKDVESEPFQIKAVSSLEGFALVGDVRCAVIRTLVHEIRKEHLKVLFKHIYLEMDTQIEEILYFDYVKGDVVAKVTRTSSYSESKGLAADFGQSQSIYYRI